MKKIIIIASVVSAFLLQSASYAGYIDNEPVYVLSGSSGGYATGSVEDAWGTIDRVQYITCSSSSSTGTDLLICSARNSVGTATFCYYLNPPTTAREAVAGINGASFIYFTSNSSGQCTWLFVTNGSQYM